MNAKLLNRLIQAIVLNDSNSLYQIAKTIIEEERKKATNDWLNN